MPTTRETHLETPLDDGDPLQLVLSRLHRVRGVGSRPDQWSARCPVCDAADGHRKNHLYVGRGDDGRVLLHCKRLCTAGKDPSGVCAAINLTPADLFPYDPEWRPDNGESRPGPPPSKSRQVRMWLEGLLWEPMPGTEVCERIRAAGIDASDRTIRRAFKAYGGVTQKVGFEGSAWVWYPPGTWEAWEAERARSAGSVENPENQRGCTKGTSSGLNLSPSVSAGRVEKPRKAHNHGGSHEGDELAESAKGTDCGPTPRRAHNHAHSHEGDKGVPKNTLERMGT